MPEQTPDETTETPTEDVPPTTDPDDDTPDDDTEGTEPRKGNPEAAKWRTRLRETETERDTFRDRLEAMQRAEVVRQASGPGRLVDGDDVFRTVALADLLGEDGNLDDALVVEAVETLVKAKPHLSRPAFGDGVGVGERNPASGATWAAVING